VINAAAMPTLASPFRWQCLVETDRAIYRFFVSIHGSGANPVALGNGSAWQRFAKPAENEKNLVAVAARDARAGVFLNFSRFPLARVQDDNCLQQALVQFVDLRYTDPGAPQRGTFGLEVPVACPK
jgi:hypothetical protein